MQLSQKETTLLKDLKEQEKLCVDKYTKHSAAASDSQLKNLFSQIAQTEQQHLNTITQMESGTTPQMSGSSSSSQATAQSSFRATYGPAESAEKKSDCYLCSDVLAGEKHVSQLYNTCIFEFKDAQSRDALNHIQKEEQEHGKMIYDYMKTNGMYS